MTVITHTTIGAKDLEAEEDFFNQILSVLGTKKGLRTERAVSWSLPPQGRKLTVSLAVDGKTTTVFLDAGNRRQVDEVHSKALALGAENDGEPGVSYDGLYYTAAFRDLDGNRVKIRHLLRHLA